MSAEELDALTPSNLNTVLTVNGVCCKTAFSLPIQGELEGGPLNVKQKETFWL